MFFVIETAVARTSHNLTAFEGAPVVAKYETDSVVDFADYLTKTTEYFTALVNATEDVEYVSLLVTTHGVAEVIAIR